MSQGTAAWHVDDELLAAYAHGDVDAAHAYSVEAHVVECATCQGRIAGHVAAPRLEDNWLAILDTLDAPRPGPAERLLVRLGVAPHLARLVAATPSLTVSWFAAVAVALAVAVAGAYQGERGLALFLCMAALAPVVGVAASFGRGIDPTHELAVAAPMSSVHVLLLRTAAVVGATVAITAVAATLLPGLGWEAAAWLLPALGLTLASLGLATYVAHTTAFATVAGLWLAVTIATALHPGDALAAFDGLVQPAFAVLVAVAALVLVRRREALDGWSAR